MRANSSLKPYKALKGLIRPILNKYMKDNLLLKPYKALKGLTRPMLNTYMRANLLLKPYKALKGLIRPIHPYESKFVAKTKVSRDSGQSKPLDHNITVSRAPALNSLIRPSRALKAPQGLIRPFRAL